jgi:hypothetical protein
MKIEIEHEGSCLGATGGTGRLIAPVGYGAGTVPARRTGVGGMEGGWNFSPPCRPLRPKKVPTDIEIIAELPACHAGAVTKSGAPPVAA